MQQLLNFHQQSEEYVVFHQLFKAYWFCGIAAANCKCCMNWKMHAHPAHSSGSAGKAMPFAMMLNFPAQQRRLLSWAALPPADHPALPRKYWRTSWRPAWGFCRCLYASVKGVCSYAYVDKELLRNGNWVVRRHYFCCDNGKRSRTDP